MKKCSKCGENKQPAQFSKESRTRDGLRASCKACDKEYAAKHYAQNNEKIKANSAKHYAEDPKKINARAAKYRAANRETIKASNAEYSAQNHEKKKASNAEYYVANIEKIRAFRAANPEVHRIYNQNRRARKRANGGKLSNGLADKLFKLQRGKCACGCKQPLESGYHMDHILPLVLGGANEDWNIQLLRQRCNNQKHAKHPIDFMQQRGFLL